MKGTRMEKYKMEDRKHVSIAAFLLSTIYFTIAAMYVDSPFIYLAGFIGGAFVFGSVVVVISHLQEKHEQILGSTWISESLSFYFIFSFIACFILNEYQSSNLGVSHYGYLFGSLSIGIIFGFFLEIIDDMSALSPYDE